MHTVFFLHYSLQRNLCGFVCTVHFFCTVHARPFFLCCLLFAKTNQCVCVVFPLLFSSLHVPRSSRRRRKTLLAFPERGARGSVVRRDEPVFPPLFRGRSGPLATEEHSILDQRAREALGFFFFFFFFFGKTWGKGLGGINGFFWFKKNNIKKPTPKNPPPPHFFFFFFFFFFAQPWDQGSGAIKGSFGFKKLSFKKKGNQMRRGTNGEGCHCMCILRAFSGGASQLFRKTARNCCAMLLLCLDSLFFTFYCVCCVWMLKLPYHSSWGFCSKKKKKKNTLSKKKSRVARGWPSLCVCLRCRPLPRKGFDQTFARALC
jgi:hypothetical protein